VLSTPLTDSLNVTVKLTVPAAVGLGDARLIETTVGGVRSNVYAWPAVENGALSVWPGTSQIELSLTRLRRRVASPGRAFAVTVYVVPEPDTPVIAGIPPTPLARPKSVGSTPVTDSLNVTVQWTTEAVDGLASARLMDTTVGEMRSTM